MAGQFEQEALPVDQQGATACVRQTGAHQQQEPGRVLEVGTSGVQAHRRPRCRPVAARKYARPPLGHPADEGETTTVLGAVVDQFASGRAGGAATGDHFDQQFVVT
ncbi:hypothetical protein GCM10010218_59900 [Streptomyces mashuensis]|uniref:Uncharacterized protein n=1 Tax=Streptomyces mashuensis TaxID=33904 RepID=A0A919EGC0_9ACTN|nr:hypothetical protein GCM10010218_59900 [Streptomyces mashuensis]